MKRLFVAALVTFLLLVGCATREELIAKSADVPAGVDLSGQWQLRVDSQDTVERLSEAGREAAGGMEALVPGSSRQPRGSSRQRSSDGPSVHVFLETGNALKVTQTGFGLFISFDRAIVEEYRYGEKRQVNVGPIIADRVSGWDGETYIIETLDEDGAKLIETYRLSGDGSKLIRKISVIDDDAGQLIVEQIFDRI